jgi:hypothetical protein
MQHRCNAPVRRNVAEIRVAPQKKLNVPLLFLYKAANQGWKIMLAGIPPIAPTVLPETK